MLHGATDLGPAPVSGSVAAAAFAAAAVLLLGVPRSGALRMADVLVHSPGATSGAAPAPPRPPSRLAALGAGVRPWPVLGGLGGLLGLTALTVGPVPGVLLALGVLAGRRWWHGRARGRAVDVEQRAIVEACSVLAGELRAGRAPSEALQAAADVAAGPARAVLRAGAATAGLGGDVAGSLATVPAGCAVPDVLRSLAACWSVCSSTGSGLAAAVDRLEEGLRAEQVLRQALAAELAGPRATAGLLAVLPVVGLLLAGALGADPLHVLLHTPLGLLCLTVGLGLDALGVLWTHRLVRRAGG